MLQTCIQTSHSSAFLSMRSVLEASECTGLWFAFRCALSQGALCTCCFRVRSSICLLVLQVTFEQRGGIKRLKHLIVSSFGLRTDSDAEEVLYAFQFADAFERFTGSHFTVAEPWGPHISEVIIICDPDLYSWVGSQSNFPNFFSRSSLETDSVKWALCTVAQRADARGLEETWCGESIFFFEAWTLTEPTATYARLAALVCIYRSCVAAATQALFRLCLLSMAYCAFCCAELREGLQTWSYNVHAEQVVPKVFRYNT